MLRRKILLTLVGISFVVAYVGIVRAVDAPGSWERTGDPVLQKVADLPDNVNPDRSNRDCTNITTQIYGSAGMQSDCVVESAIGLSGGSGTTITGSSQEIPILPYGGYIGLLPIPHQAMYITYSPAPVLGLTLNFYKSILDKVKSTPDLVNDRWQYTLTAPPEMTLKDSYGRALAVNTDTVAFSPNGNWMIADIPYQGFVRINLATFEMVPFAASVNAYSDGNVSAQVTVSNDGRYAAIKPDTTNELKVYDINSCNGATLPVNPLIPKCLSRDYLPTLTKQVANFKAVYHPRFSGTNQLIISVMHDYVQSGIFKVSQYLLTAPGENPYGIEYLGMGDSYASGQGAFNYTAGTDTANNTCHLSALSYPFLLSNDLFSNGHSIACSGAVMDDITGDPRTYGGQNTPKHTESALRDMGQLASIIANYAPGYILQSDFVDTYNPQAITLSIGGNDVGFSDIVTQCVASITHGTCYNTYEDQQELLNRVSHQYDRLISTYKAVAAAGRKVYIIGYPQIVAQNGDCADNVHLNPDEITMFIGLTNALNSVIAKAATAAGVQYVDVSTAFYGHRMCETSSANIAVNGLTNGTDTGFLGIKFIGNESYHPNVLGHQLLEQAILKQTNNLKGIPAATTPPDFPQPSATAPKTNRPLNQSIYDNNLLPPVVTAGTATQISTNPAAAILKPAGTYTVSLDTDTTPLTVLTANSSGIVAGSVTMPTATACGYHSLHISGTSFAGEAVDITTTTYVTGAGTDCAATTTAVCGVVPASGIDSDKDGVDDACDPLITAPALYTVYMKGSSIHASKQ